MGSSFRRDSFSVSTTAGSLSDIRLGTVQVNATDVPDLAAPAELRVAQTATPAVAAAPPVTITVTEPAPGVWFLAGQSHHSVVIEMADHLLLVEAPQNDARTLAVIQRARTLNPSKPLRAVINTHHHFDHSGGIRAAMSEGLTVITQEQNKPFFDSLALRRHSLESGRVGNEAARSRASREWERSA